MPILDSKINIDFDFAINHDLVPRSDLDLGVQNWGCKGFEHDVNSSGFPQEPLRIVWDITHFNENEMIVVIFATGYNQEESFVKAFSWGPNFGWCCRCFTSQGGHGHDCHIMMTFKRLVPMSGRVKYHVLVNFRPFGGQGVFLQKKY